MVSHRLTLTATCLVILFANLSCCSPLESEPYKKFQASYYEINEHLEKVASKSNNVEEIMTKAIEWLKSIEVSGENKNLIEPLRLFTSMLDLLQENSCNFYGYQVLVNNYQALSNLVRYGIRKIDKVAKELVRRHVQVCASVYPRVYGTKINQLDGETFKRVQTLGKSMIAFNAKRNFRQLKAKSAEEALQSSPMGFIYLMGREEARDERAEACQMADLLEYHMDDPRSQFEASNLAKLFQQHMVEPCEKFSHLIGPDVYLPAELDSRARRDERLGQLDDGPTEYRLGMAFYRACEAYVLGAQVNRSKLIEIMSTC